MSKEKQVQKVYQLDEWGAFDIYNRLNKLSIGVRFCMRKIKQQEDEEDEINEYLMRQYKYHLIRNKGEHHRLITLLAQGRHRRREQVQYIYESHTYFIDCRLKQLLRQWRILIKSSLEYVKALGERGKHYSAVKKSLERRQRGHARTLNKLVHRRKARRK